MNYNISFPKETTYSLNVTISGLHDIDVDKIYMTVKRNVNNQEYVLQKRLNEGIEKIEDYKYRITIDKEDTKEMLNNASYGYDVVIIVGDKKKQILVGILKLSDIYTRKENEV